MSTAAAWMLPMRLAWRQLRHEPARLLAALSGVLFACLLIFMQLGFMDALFDSAVKPQAGMRADLYLMHRQTEALWRTQPFPRARLMQALGVEGVDRVVPLYVGNAAWKNPVTSLKRTLLVFGAAPESGLLDYEGLDDAGREAIRRADVVLFDERSKPEFGPIPALLAEGPLFVELANRRVEVAGLFRIGATFGSEGNALTSETNFLRLFPNRTFGHVDVGAIFLLPGVDAAAVKARIAPLLAEDVMLMTRQELVDFELRYWAEAAPIGFIFGMGVVIGLVVGCVIVYQILFSDIARHIGEYATLKAMGYSNGYLARVVLGASLILAVAGYVPGWLASKALYILATEKIFIPLTLDLEKSILVFCLVFGMCVISGLLAIRKLRDANPADMF
ncbi:ABC transporter permease DevC [Elioraea rosea]|uniref:ABC transporter permease DevC n=1 Tax=Elioraea rosea TaxID=2492390 RepID=UPI001EF5F4BC|nr:ABC transporter permease DevC [Elioraea rosea]